MKATIKSPIATLYKEKSAMSEAVDECLYGMGAEVINVQGEWAYIETFYRYSGYTKLDNLAIGIDMPVAQHCSVVKPPMLDIMRDPDVRAQAIVSLPRGSRVVDLGSSSAEGWKKVGLMSGETGYSLEGFFMPLYTGNEDATEEQVRERILAFAKSYLGSQYRWGGKTPGGIDCSGLCSISYLLSGIVIYRDSALVEGFALKQIDFRDAKPADVIFFDGHVALYLGDGLYIHSTAYHVNPGVVINSFDPKEPSYRQSLHNSILYAGSAFAE
ncbi:MAG: C40 family peptidase [Eubacteriaceae bacterium]|nr:C40 family peptidase [Eubacteriaceae bacterium]